VLLEVKRTLIPLGVDGPWEQRQYVALVWKYDMEGAHVIPLTIPRGYARGLLATYINGASAALPAFDAALDTIGLTRLSIERAIREEVVPDA
jgi:hypothetical protein